ncbi:MAG: Ribitol-5-phosphate cytidylyltransferase [Eubacteriales bacterium SKADARSKE-1]|nr:Ribitol-5-phosphate cytidylyltransferase [Eubacteriales bacterium SKADARSKE-1]
MIFGAILAGGIGKRMNIADLPKQFLLLDNKPIIIHTIEKFLIVNRFDKIYIGVHSDWIQYMNDLIEKYNLDKTKLVVVAGGKDRSDTILNIITAIKNSFPDNKEDVIVTHDSVRPFVTKRIIDDNIDAAIKYGACDTVVSSADTIVVSNNNDTITDIPNRNFMYQGQTPQSFKLDLLLDSYKRLTDAEKDILTDACKVCVMKGVAVKLVMGEYSNFKITTINDYKVAQAMVGGKKLD